MKKYGLQPPYFIYNEKKIKSNLLKFREMLPKNFDIYYSIKANPNHVILNIFRQLGVGAEISSGGELDLVKNAGFVTNRIIFTGPGKTTRELERAILSKIYLIIVESLNEIKRINKIASKLKIKQKILIRINPLIFCAQPDSMFPMIGGGQKFGIDEEEILNLIKAILLFENIDISGFHFFTGSNIFDEQVIINNTEHLFKLVNSYELFFKRKFSIIDIGGGLALNYSQENNKHFDIKKLTKGLSFLVEKYNLKDKNIIIESGRFLVGESGEYIVEVVDVKISRGETFVIINGGVNHISRATLAKNGHEIEVMNKKVKNKKIKVSIFGNLNTPTDFITKTKLPVIKIGDIISIKKVGAYGLTSGMPLFTSRPFPREYLLMLNNKVKNITNARD